MPKHTKWNPNTLIKHSDAVIIDRIRARFEFLWYNQDIIQYRKVYTNGNDAMYYCAGTPDTPTNPTVVLIGNLFKAYYATPLVKNVNGRNDAPMRQVLNQAREIIYPMAIDFDDVHLNNDNSFRFSQRGITSAEFDTKFQKVPYSGTPDNANPTNRNLSKLPNGMIIRFKQDDIFVRSIQDAAGHDILSDIEYVQKLSGNTVVIWQKIMQKKRSTSDLFIIDFDAKPWHYKKAFTFKNGENLKKSASLSGTPIDAYINRYLNVANAVLGPQNQK